MRLLFVLFTIATLLFGCTHQPDVHKSVVKQPLLFADIGGIRYWHGWEALDSGYSGEPGYKLDTTNIFDTFGIKIVNDTTIYVDRSPHYISGILTYYVGNMYRFKDFDSVNKIAFQGCNTQGECVFLMYNYSNNSMYLMYREGQNRMPLHHNVDLFTP